MSAARAQGFALCLCSDHAPAYTGPRANLLMCAPGTTGRVTTPYGSYVRLLCAWCFEAEYEGHCDSTAAGREGAPADE